MNYFFTKLADGIEHVWYGIEYELPDLTTTQTLFLTGSFALLVICVSI